MIAQHSGRRLRRGVVRGAEALLGSLQLVTPRPVVQPIAPSAPLQPSQPPPTPAHQVQSQPAEHSDLTYDGVQAVLDDLVRPALQADGGDIELVRVEADVVYVTLVGACHSCPSAVLTLKMGVEQLLADELPGFGSLVQVDPTQEL